MRSVNTLNGTYQVKNTEMKIDMEYFLKDLSCYGFSKEQLNQVCASANMSQC